MTAQDRMERPLAEVDPQVYEPIERETHRQHSQIELIASENFTSEAILEAAGSVFTNKYAEGYPGKRYYAGCEFADVVENLARERALKLFGAKHPNAQRGPLPTRNPPNLAGKTYKLVLYGVRRDYERID